MSILGCCPCWFVCVTATGTHKTKKERPSAQERSSTITPSSEMPLTMPSKMLSVASAFPDTSYTQLEMIEVLQVSNPVVQRLLHAPHIQKRHLLLPVRSDATMPSGSCPETHIASVHNIVSCPASPASTSSARSSHGDACGGMLPLTPSELESRASPTSDGGRLAVLNTPTKDAATPSPLFPQGGCNLHETRAELHRRHIAGLRSIGADAARRALRDAAIDADCVRIVVAVTSTGLAMPGFSAMLMEELGLKPSVLRLDVVGMGCNAGMSGLRTLSTMLSGLGDARAIGLLVCCEVCSAVYVNDDTTATGIVNSLFGDGAVATVLQASTTTTAPITTSAAAAIEGSTFAPPGRLKSVPTNNNNSAWEGIALTDFESCTLTEYFDDMQFDVPAAHDRMCFKLSKRIPYAVGDNVATPVTALLERHGLVPKDVAHWVVHSGGAAVIDGVVRNLGLPSDALRHTTSVLRDYGNISSGSFLVSLERLLQEDQLQGRVVQARDVVVFIAMGPGATIEVGLGHVCPVAKDE